jgi:hypothetical protein
MMTLPDKNKVERLRRELAEAEKELEDWQNSDNTNEQKIALMLHSQFCGFNHTDGCGWYYEYKDGSKDNWDGHAHRRWLDKTTTFWTAVEEMASKIRGKKGFELISTYLQNIPSVGGI